MQAAPSGSAVLDVTTATARLDLDTGDEADIDFVVTNVGTAALTAAARPKFDRGPQLDWFRLDGPGAQEYEPGASEQFRLRVRVPDGVEPLDYRISLQAYAADHPGEVYFSGPWVWLAVRQRPPPPPLALPGVPRPVASSALLALLVAAAALCLLIDNDGLLAPAVWMPKAWVAGPISLLLAAVGGAALWLLLGDAPVESHAPRPPWWHVLASTAPGLVLLSSVLLWWRAGWPWLVPGLLVEIALGWSMLAWALRRRALRRSAGESSRVPAWWVVVGVGLVLLVLVSAAAAIHGVRPVPDSEAVDGICPAGSPCPDEDAASSQATALVVALVAGVPLAGLVALSMLWLLRGTGPGTFRSLTLGIVASAALLVVVGTALWPWLGALALAAVLALGLLLAIGFALVAIKPELRLFAIVLLVLVCLYLGSASLSLKNESGDMERAMAEARELVADAREEIRKEMEKPFILRLFGSLFGMEGNSFQKLKDRLPGVIEPAMPKITADFSLTSPALGIACEGMRLADALAYLRERDIALGEIRWRYEDEVFEERYVQLGGTVLEASLAEDGSAVLVLQLFHDYSGEEGLGEDADARAEARAALAVRAAQLAVTPPLFQEWLSREDQAEIQAVERAGLDLRRWRARPIARDPG